MLNAFNPYVIYVRCEEMTDWTTHHFSGSQDEQGRFKGKGELQLKQVEKTIMVKVLTMMMKVKVMMMR